MWKVCVGVAAFSALAGVAGAIENQITIDGSSSPHSHGSSTLAVEPAFEDYAFMLWDACDAMELTGEDCNILPMNGDLGGNALAMVLDGNKIIIYDRELSPMLGYEGAMAVIAHELGHHYCGHLSEPASMQQEFEADRFAGAAMRGYGWRLADALSMAVVLDERAGQYHPARPDRIEAITEGWQAPAVGKDCR